MDAASSQDAEPVFEVQQLLGPRDDILAVVARRLGNVLFSQGERRCGARLVPPHPAFSLTFLCYARGSHARTLSAAVLVRQAAHLLPGA